MNNKIIRSAAAALAALMLTSVPVSAEFTNTAGDWMYRTETSLDDIGAEFYHTLSDEAKKDADGWLGNPALGKDLSYLLGEGARGVEVFRYNGSTEYKIPENGDAGNAAKEALDNATAARTSDVLAEINKIYAAFKNDHPECFWLSGESYSYYSMSYSFTTDGKVNYTITYYLILCRTAKDGTAFDVRYDKYTDLAVLREDIARRDSAVDEILASAPVADAKNAAETLTALNDALTKRNAYRSDSVGDTSYMSHESLSALVGSVGKDGPVCDGYAKAFKVLCDNAGITCTTVSGNSVNSLKKNGEHTWNAVMINGLWYAVDVTFNDPVAGDPEKAVSGFENHDFLLVGSDTVIHGKRFSETHIPDNKLTTKHDTELDAPELFYCEYEKTPDEAVSTRFTDLDETLIYYGEIKYAWDLRRMIGVTEELFAPDVSLTRGMIVTILWRREGSPKVELDEPFTDVPDNMWFTDAIAWAQSEDIVKGYGDGTYGPYDTLTREQTFKILQRYAYYKGYDATVHTKYPSLSGYEYSDWADTAAVFARHFMLTDREQELYGTARREEIAAYLRRFDAAFGQGEN